MTLSSVVALEGRQRFLARHVCAQSFQVVSFLSFSVTPPFLSCGRVMLLETLRHGTVTLALYSYTTSRNARTTLHRLLYVDYFLPNLSLPWYVQAQESNDVEAGNRAIDKDELNIKIRDQIVQIEAGSKIEVKQAPTPQNGPRITYGMPSIMTVNGKSVPAMPAPWLMEPKWVDEEWQAKLRVDPFPAPLLENPNARFILFDKSSVPQMVDDDKYRKVRRQLVPQMALQPMQNSMMRSPQPTFSSMALPTAPPSMGSAAPSMFLPPQGGMPGYYPGGPQGLYPGAPGR